MGPKWSTSDDLVWKPTQCKTIEFPEEFQESYPEKVKNAEECQSKCQDANMWMGMTWAKGGKEKKQRTERKPYVCNAYKYKAKKSKCVYLKCKSGEDGIPE